MELAQEVERLQQQVESLGRNSQAPICRKRPAKRKANWETHKKIWEKTLENPLEMEISLGKFIGNGGFNEKFIGKYGNAWENPLEI